jgi:hypothetical protein
MLCFWIFQISFSNMRNFSCFIRPQFPLHSSFWTRMAVRFQISLLDLHSKIDSVESTFLRRRINVNSHTLSFYDSYSWFYFIVHRFYVFGVLFGINCYLPRRRFEPTTVWLHVWHKNTKPHPNVHGYSNSRKMN